jgi:ABC-type phosphate transport system substrate-binding protein
VAHRVITKEHTHMRTTKIRALVGLGAVGAATLALGVVTPAEADYAPALTDVVGVGGDTPQYDLDFLADGDATGNAGYNSASLVNKLVSFDATADANGRTAYVNGSASLLNPTIVFRAGTKAIQRPQSTGAAYTLIAADTAHVVDFIRAGVLPTSVQQAAVPGGLHVVQLGTDSLITVTATTSNAPATLSITDLLNIYTGAVTDWHTLNASAPVGSTIVPLLPPSSSVINKTLLADLKTANGNVAPTLAATVRTVEQNDPSVITGLSATEKPNAIVTFSQGRLNLFNNGYFQNPATVFPGGSVITPGVKAEAGYTSALVHYVVFRQSDTAAGVLPPWQPGSTKNWIQTLFSAATGTPYLKSPAGQALIASSGITPAYSDLGVVSFG